MFKWSYYDKIALPIVLAFIICISILLHFLLKNKSEKIKQIPLHIISVTLIILEITKQIYFIATNTYTAKVLPIHFCSLIVVIIALTQFLPKKISKWLDVPSIIFPLAVMVLILIHPYAMIGNSSQTMFISFTRFHAFYFHALIMLYPILKLSLIKFNLKLKYSLSIIGCLVFYSTYAIPLAFKLNNNYLNILHSDFYPLEQFRLTYGQVAYDIVIYVLGISVCVGVYLIWYLIYKLKEKRRLKHA